ncbi:MAG: hypothetical protein ACE5H9_19190 [Anaerolineae bacterium]
MSEPLPLAGEEYLEQVEYQGKTIRVGDAVIVPEAGQQRRVEVSSILKKQGHYWVGYDDNRRFCPWPLVRQL